MGEPDLAGKRILVLGLGASGRSAATFCAERGATVVVADERKTVSVPEFPRSVSVVLGSIPAREEFDIVVPSPGIPPARYAGATGPVWGDVELAFQALRVPVIAVTGTNGKSTTVLLLEALLRELGFRVRAAGNLGVPALSLVGEALDVAVLEVSSFQLETTETFRPKVGVLLNFSPDHLDRHGSLDAYAAAKARIFAAQGPDDFAVVNGDDPRCVEIARSGSAQRLRFTRADSAADAWWDGDVACLRTAAGVVRIPLSAEDTSRTPRQNLLAALLCLGANGCDPAAAISALPAFEPPPHRLQRVGRPNGVLFVDDSKATNPAAAAAALEALPGPLVWIAGGRDKGLPFADLMRVASQRVRHAVFYGEAGPSLLGAASALTAEFESLFRDAVLRAYAAAEPGDTLLLAPACASFDQFASFEDRGDAFHALARELESSS